MPPLSFRDGPKDQTRNLEIPGSMLTHRPGMPPAKLDFPSFCLYLSPISTEDPGSMKPPRKLHIKSYGCQMNVYDAQRMVDTLAADGFVETANADEADLVILNTCHIREKASA